jgi:hypothetical protein
MNDLRKSNLTLPHRTPSTFRRRLAGLVGMLGLLLGISLISDSARADTLWMCGHQIRTSYDQGWVILDSVEGVGWENQRPDIVVYGTMRNINVGQYAESTALAAIYAGTRWGWMQSRIRINGHPDCNVVLH